MIYVNGDSWSVRMPEATDEQVWPKLIADRLGESLINESVGCASNSRAHSCLENFLIAGNRPKLVVIALTGPIVGICLQLIWDTGILDPRWPYKNELATEIPISTSGFGATAIQK